MTLRDVIEKLSDWVNIRVVVSKYDNVIVTYEDDTLIVTVDDSKE